MRMKMSAVALILLLLVAPWALADLTTTTTTVVVNTSGADFTVVPAVSNQRIYITSIAVQHAGFTNPVNFKLCDGSCATATQILGPFILSPGVLGKSAGGLWGPDACAERSCVFNMSKGNALIAQADMGQVNNVTVMVTYYYFFGS